VVRGNGGSIEVWAETLVGRGGRATTHRGARWRGDLRGCIVCHQSQCELCGVGGAAAVVTACSGGVKAHM